MPGKLSLYLHFTKSPKRDVIHYDMFMDPKSTFLLNINALARKCPSY